MVKVPVCLGTSTKLWLTLADMWPLTNCTCVDWPLG